MIETTTERSNMNDLQIFSNSEFGEIRTITKDDEALFCLGDLCRILELTAKGVKQRLTDEVISNYPIPDSLGRIQNTIFVNEDGLYDVILDSRKENARKFRKWVTSEVLPTIRKTGGYSMPKTTGGQIQLLAQGYTELEQAVNSIKEDMTELKDNTPLYGCEIDEVKQHVNRKGVIVLGGKDSEAYKNGSIRSSVYSDIYKQVKREFGCVTTYKSIRRKYIDNVHKFIDDYALPMALAEQVKEANAQISMSF
jgi:prophage antirepressor-like protein